jgi:hypothetical protein
MGNRQEEFSLLSSIFRFSGLSYLERFVVDGIRPAENSCHQTRSPTGWRQVECNLHPPGRIESEDKGRWNHAT